MNSSEIRSHFHGQKQAENFCRANGGFSWKEWRRAVEESTFVECKLLEEAKQRRYIIHCELMVCVYIIEFCITIIFYIRIEGALSNPNLRLYNTLSQL